VTDIFFLGKMHVNHCQQNKDKTFMTPDSWYATLWKSSIGGRGHISFPIWKLKLENMKQLAGLKDWN
jgi:hypothetical protein